MISLLEVIKRTTEFFEKRGVEDARLNAELIVAHTLGLNRMQLYLQFERPLTDAQLDVIRPLVRRRGQREPLQYLLGSVQFHDLKLKVDGRALIPRPETEQLVERILADGAPSPSAILDLGTGTGALALALAQAYPNADVWAVDRSSDALALASENAAGNGLTDRIRFVESNWFSAIPADSHFDLIVANPPYLTDSEWETAEAEVRVHEPRGALVADNDGLSDLLIILEAGRAHLRPAGRLFLETGIEQHERLLERCRELGYVDAAGIEDWSGRPRFIRAAVPSD